MQSSLARRAALALALAAGSAAVHAQDAIKIVGVYELSGAAPAPAPTSRTASNWPSRRSMPTAASSARRSTTTWPTRRPSPAWPRACAKGCRRRCVRVFGPVFSGSIMVSMAETQRAEIPNFTGGEAAAITAQGNPYVFRTSFGQATSFPKVARYIQGKAKTLAVVYVNNDFGKGGRDTHHQAARGQRRRRSWPTSPPTRPAGLLRRRAQGQAEQCRRAVCLPHRGRVGPRAARAAQAGLDQAHHRRDHADQPEGDRAGR
jgi:hypothetical protein